MFLKKRRKDVPLPTQRFVVEAGPRPDLPFIRFKDRNVELAAVSDTYRQGQTPAQIAAWFDSLDAHHIKEAITFYHQHQAEMNRYLDEMNVYAAEERRNTPVHPSIARVKEAMKQ